MTKPRKFHTTLNQPPRSMKNHGKHRRASPQAHSRPAHGASSSPGGAFASGLTLSSWGTLDLSFSFYVPLAHHAGALFATGPEQVPYAGIRTGEITGYRMWRLVEEHGEPALSSLVTRQIWVPRATAYGDVNKPCCSSPLCPTMQGVYAFETMQYLMQEVRQEVEDMAEWRARPEGFQFMRWNAYKESGTVVVGKVKLWGEVVEHQFGWRAECAKITGLYAMLGEQQDDMPTLNCLRTQHGV